MKIERHNLVLTELWQQNLNKEGAFALCLLGITKAGMYSIHAPPGTDTKAIARRFREAADSLERGKNTILRGS